MEETNFVNCEFYVAGLPMYDYEKAAREIPVGTVVVLEPEPTNKFDKNAVKILTAPSATDPGVMLGYVAAKTGEALVVSRALKAGALLRTEVTYNEPEKENKWRRLKVWITEAGAETEEVDDGS